VGVLLQVLCTAITHALLACSPCALACEFMYHASLLIDVFFTSQNEVLCKFMRRSDVQRTV
jgi:hypothetical protein